MKTLRWTCLVALFALLASCGGDSVLKCDADHDYLHAVAVPKVKSPPDLDSLDELKEVPVPEASPQREAPANSDCLEAPPTLLGQE